MRANIAISRNETAVLVTNKLIRNTYTLLSLTLLFSAMTCAISSGAIDCILSLDSCRSQSYLRGAE